MTTQLSSYLYIECCGLWTPHTVSQSASTSAHTHACTHACMHACTHAHKKNQKIKKVLNMVAHACAPSTEDVEARGS